MSIPREGSRDIEEGILVSSYPDWCKVPEKPCPFPLYAKQHEDANTAPSVRQTSKRSHTTKSIITCSHGDEAGIGLGVESGTRGSICQPKTWSETVRFESANAVRHNDEWFMNNKNTTGKMTYVEDTERYEPTIQLTKNKEDKYYKQADLSNTQPNENFILTNGRRIPIRRTPNLGGAGAGGTWGPKPGTTRPNNNRSQNNRTTSNKNKPKPKLCKCLVGDYKIIRPLCNRLCGATAQAHHIIPDKTLRFGKRNDDGNRILTPDENPDYPNLDNGPAICLDGQASVVGTAHNLAHQADKKVIDLGKNSRIKGMAPFKDIAKLYVKSAIAARPNCRTKIKAAVKKTFGNLDDHNGWGRTQKNPFKPKELDDLFDKIKSY